MMTPQRLEEIRKAVACYRSRGADVSMFDEMLAEIDRLNVALLAAREDAYELSTLAACTKRKNTDEFMAMLFERIETVQAKYRPTKGQ